MAIGCSSPFNHNVFAAASGLTSSPWAKQPNHSYIHKAESLLSPTQRNIIRVWFTDTENMYACMPRYSVTYSAKTGTLQGRATNSLALAISDATSGARSSDTDYHILSHWEGDTSAANATGKVKSGAPIYKIVGGKTGLEEPHFLYDCKMTNCKEDATVGVWGTFGPCADDGTGQGRHCRTRSITTAAKCGGTTAALEECKDCVLTTSDDDDEIDATDDDSTDDTSTNGDTTITTQSTAVVAVAPAPAVGAKKSSTGLIIGGVAVVGLLGFMMMRKKKAAEWYGY